MHVKRTRLEEFRTASDYAMPPLPPGVKPWTYRYEYPSQAQEDAPWLEKKFLKNNIVDPKVAREFCEEIRKYIAKNLDTDKFYNAPWLHREEAGREPVSGLRLGGVLESGHLSDKQDGFVQGWTNHYYNAKAATILHQVWGNGSEAPTWNQNIHFPEGSLIVEQVYCNADENQMYTLKNAPTAWACIANLDQEGKPVGRRDKPELLHLVQLDFRARAPNDWNLPIGWVYGTFIYDGTKEIPSADRMDDLIPVGVQWGNDPTLTQATHDDGAVSKECWINGHALDIYKSLKGATVGLGWHGRLDGPGDDFMSTCSSCHAVAQTPHHRILEKDELTPVPPLRKIPKDGSTNPGIYVEVDGPRGTMRWFRNVKAGELFDDDKDYMTADYCWGLQIGYQNYLKWERLRA